MTRSILCERAKGRVEKVACWRNGEGYCVEGFFAWVGEIEETEIGPKEKRRNKSCGEIQEQKAVFVACGR